jgi:hypothetical protein
VAGPEQPRISHTRDPTGLLDGFNVEAEPALATPCLDHGPPGGLVQARVTLNLSLKRIIDPTDRAIMVPGTPGNPENINAPGTQSSQQHLRHPVGHSSEVDMLIAIPFLVQWGILFWKAGSSGQ